MVSNNQKKEKFIELAKSRVNRAINMIRLISNLANKSHYDYTPEQTKKIIKALNDEVRSVEAKFASKKEGQRNLVYNFMNKKIKNFELVTLALYFCGGYTKFIGTEDVAIQSDKMDNQRFRWKKYKEFIDRGLIFDCLNTARTRK